MGKPLLFCCVLLFQYIVHGLTMSPPRKSDPMTDTENMADHPGVDSTLIPPNLVMHEEVSMSDTIGDPLNPNDFSQAQEINNVPFDAENFEDPILLADLFQGDIRISSNDELFSLTAHTSLHGQNATQLNAIIDTNKRWPNAQIPYVISASYTSEERATIAKAMAAYHQHTCIKFVPRRSETDYIHITKGSGCSSAVGVSGGQQTVSLGNGCLYFGIVIHELMHAAGFWHEQSRADRDDHITIVWSNIMAGMDYNFQKYDWNMIQSLGVSYDTGSIMHYGEKSFAKDRSRPTIISKNGQSIGQRNNFSTLDMEKINKLYECNKGTSGGVTTQAPPPVPIPDNCLDNHENCQFWADKGECQTNPAWMNPNCQKACNQCGKCQDENKWCPDWKKRGECERSASYMEIHCKSSCGLCSGPSVPKPTTLCKNEHIHCDAWAQLGECDVNPVYMKKYCAKSCNSC